MVHCLSMLDYKTAIVYYVLSQTCHVRKLKDGSGSKPTRRFSNGDLNIFTKY